MTPGPDAPEQPARWEADVVLRDGGTAHVRPIAPDDADRLRRFHARLSAETIYFRFFAPYPTLSDRDIARFTQVDHVDRVALVALVGEEMIGVVRYERTGPAEAEVAFNIEDAHQGRGVGPVLLDHIAAAARERGVARFTAEVLPVNRRMIKVFQDAGYDVSSDYDEGIVSLTFDIAETTTAREVMQAREQRAEARSVERLLAPSSVAVVGASRLYGSLGQTVLRNLLAAGFRGTVHAVNSGAGELAAEVAGVRAYPSLLDVPGPVDLAVVAVPADAVEQVVRDGARKGVQGLVVLSAGFAETGAHGRVLQHRLVATARANGMRIVGPNSFGMINTNPAVALNASLSPVVPAPGRIGFFSQSGALGIALLEAVVDRGLGLSQFVSAGNRADISGNDLMQLWGADPDTDVLLLYLESIGNPRKFSRLARRIGRTKPVVAIKSGRFTQGVPLGHSVQVSQAPPEAVDALFRQAGVIRVDTVHQLFDVAQLLVSQPLPAGDRVAVLGNSDALGLLAADAVESRGLTLVGDPVALGAEASAEDFRRALAGVLDDPAVDCVVAVFIPPLLTPDEEVAAVLEEAAGRGTKTVVSTFLGTRGVPAGLPDGLPAAGVGGPGEAAVVGTGEPGAGSTVWAAPSYASPEDAVRALAAACRYAAWRSRPHGTVPDLPGVDAAAARRMVESRLAATPAGRGLDAAETTGLLGCYGIELWPALPVTSVQDAVEVAAGLGWPVALKTTAPHLQHRTDLGGVRLNIADAEDLRAAWSGMVAALGEEGASHLVVQRMCGPGVATVVGSSEDPLFGPILTFGLAGVATELLGDRAYRIPPLTDQDVADLVRSVRAAPLLFGHRGADPVDVPALEDLLARMSLLAQDLPEVAVLELNPVVVTASGVAVLHAVLRLAPPVARADTGPRALSSSALALRSSLPAGSASAGDPPGRRAGAPGVEG